MFEWNVNGITFMEFRYLLDQYQQNFINQESRWYSEGQKEDNARELHPTAIKRKKKKKSNIFMKTIKLPPCCELFY